MLREGYKRRATVSQCLIVGVGLGVGVWGASAMIWAAVDWVHSHGLQNQAMVFLVLGGVWLCLRER